MSTLILIGCAWGFLEATLGGFLHSLQSPITGAIMMPIGFALLHLGVRNGLKPVHIFSASLIAASFKFIDPLLFSMPFFHIRVMDPAAAIIIQGSVFAVAAPFFFKQEVFASKTAVQSLLIVLSSIFIFNLFSLSVFGQGMKILPVNIFTSVVLTTILIFASDKSRNFAFISPAWRYASASALFALAIITKVFLA